MCGHRQHGWHHHQLETRHDHFGSANSVTTAIVATTVCINTSIAWALGVTPANLGDFVKLSRSGSANESASAQTATNRNFFSGCVETALRTTYVREAITTPPTHPERIGSKVKGGKSLGTCVKRSPASAIMMSIAKAKVQANNIKSDMRSIGVSNSRG